jgi:hypothetical protein
VVIAEFGEERRSPIPEGWSGHEKRGKSNCFEDARFHITGGVDHVILAQVFFGCGNQRSNRPSRR